MHVLLVVDLQREFRDIDGQYERILNWVKTVKGYDKIIATKCLNSMDSPFVKYENWYDCIDSVCELEFQADKVIEKYGYGLIDYSKLSKTDTYNIVGFNTDACVLKIAMDLFDRNYDFKVLTDFCYSSNGLEHHQYGVELLQRLMSKAIK